jgi:hypothetical protein
MTPTDSNGAEVQALSNGVLLDTLLVLNGELMYCEIDVIMLLAKNIIYIHK